MTVMHNDAKFVYIEDVIDILTGAVMNVDYVKFEWYEHTGR